MSQSTPTRRANYTREEFNIEVVSMHGETASAVLTPEGRRTGRGGIAWTSSSGAKKAA